MYNWTNNMNHVLFLHWFQVPLSDVVEPPDFEDFLVQHHGSFDRDPMRGFLDYPADDLEVELLRRRVRTIAPIIPERGYAIKSY